MKFQSRRKQSGLSIVGLIFSLVILGGIGILMAQVVPAVIEYRSIQNAMEKAKASGTTVREIQAAFDKNKAAGYFDAISGADLEVMKNGSDVEVSFAYQKKIPLFGPASILFEFAGTTAKPGAKALKAPE